MLAAARVPVRLAFLLFGIWGQLLATGAVQAENVTQTVSKSTVAFLADPLKRNIQSKAHVFIPAGTGLLLFDRRARSGTYRLALTEFGVWSYVREDGYFVPSSLEDFKKRGDFVFIARHHPIKLGDDLTGVLTPSETYEVVERTGQNVKIKVDNRKFRDFKDDWFRRVFVPISITNTTSFSTALAEDSISYFSRGFLDNVFELFKPCNETDIREQKISGSGGIHIDIGKFSIGFSASAERQRVRQFDSGESVIRRYYKRNNVPGDYSLTRVQQCDGSDKDQVKYHVIYPEPAEIVIDAAWAESYSLLTNRRTGEVVVSCYRDYDRYAEALIDSGLPQDDVPFFLSVTAKWKIGDDFRTCRIE